MFWIWLFVCFFVKSLGYIFSRGQNRVSSFFSLLSFISSRFIHSFIYEIFIRLMELTMAMKKNSPILLSLSANQNPAHPRQPPPRTNQRARILSTNHKRSQTNPKRTTSNQNRPLNRRTNHRPATSRWTKRRSQFSFWNGVRSRKTMKARMPRPRRQSTFRRKMMMMMMRS